MLKFGVVVVVAILLLIFIPVAIARTTASEARRLQGVSLEETSFEETNFDNPAQGLRLGGMLFLPEGEGPFPGVVIVHGSGTSRRDNRWYLTVAQHLQERGIAVLLPDKRGSEKSEGDWLTASFEALATDTIAAVEYLERQERVAISRIGIIGMSQGGHFAPLIANQSPHVSYVVNVVGAAVPIHEQLIYEERNNLRELGMLPFISDLLAYPAAWSIRELRQKKFWSAVGEFDPLPHWQSLKVEALVLYGEIDSNVPSAQSAALLQSLDKPNIEVNVYEGSGHALEDPEGQGTRIFRDEALDDISDFILSTSVLP